MELALNIVPNLKIVFNAKILHCAMFVHEDFSNLKNIYADHVDLAVKYVLGKSDVLIQDLCVINMGSQLYLIQNNFLSLLVNHVLIVDANTACFKIQVIAKFVNNTMNKNNHCTERLLSLTQHVKYLCQWLSKNSSISLTIAIL